ncbi:uncharacterized protein LOC118564647 [Fundulus heteroclitus]|uniref:uncharacterized protein LOC118564645 n=1 Tax=Fundulus heteroclitus TaxID=8078 RepID=UPI00165BA674|nr:uncharacterized protein LOC118564645 [Fundulus heteroclitus]XP_035999427.1 uncharacterized protein LOC118564647 [Fundulus heteroclitus]
MNNYAVERTTASTSSQHGSPDSDKFFPGPYHPPFPSPTPESSSKLDSDSESLLTSLQRRIDDWANAPGGMHVRPEYFVLRDENSTLPTTLPARLPAMPSLSETQEEDLQVLNLPPTPEVSQDSQLPSGQGDPASPDPSQPEDTLLPSSQGETDTGADEYNGWKRFGFIKAVKTVVFHLLNAAIGKYMHGKCYGCNNNRPSQRDHECSELLQNGLFERNYKGVMRLLYNARFFDAVQRFLTAHNIHQDNHTVNAVVQAYLYELTMAKELFHTILDGYDEMVEENYELKDQLEAITRYWQGS